MAAALRSKIWPGDADCNTQLWSNLKHVIIDNRLLEVDPEKWESILSNSKYFKSKDVSTIVKALLEVLNNFRGKSNVLKLNSSTNVPNKTLRLRRTNAYINPNISYFDDDMIKLAISLSLKDANDLKLQANNSESPVILKDK